MRLMNEPEGPMEEILVDQPRKDLHADDGQKNSSAALRCEHDDEQRSKMKEDKHETRRSYIIKKQTSDIITVSLPESLRAVSCYSPESLSW